MKMRKIKWYEAYNINTKKHYYWTQRDNNGVCFEIRINKDSVSLYICDNFYNKYKTVGEAQKVAHNMWNKGIVEIA